MEALRFEEGNGEQDKLCGKKCFNQEFADRVAQLCHSKYASLPKTGKPIKDLEWTVLSAVLVDRECSSEVEVVSLATGSKCIGMDKMSPRGDILNDSHAEVLARRGFLRYLYHQIHVLKNASRSETLFEREDQKYGVRRGVTFHLYCSHTPCGDASIFPKMTTSFIGEDDVGTCISDTWKRTGDDTADVLTPTKRPKLERNDDIHRTGAKCLPNDSKHDEHQPGSSYHVLGAVRTKPGRGVPTLSVSCSDKIMRWNCVGLQGALLSLLLDKPVYLKSIIVGGGCPYSPDAMKRAVVDRVLPAGSHLPPNYFINSPIFLRATIPFPDGKLTSNASKPCPSSLIWCSVPYRKLEVAVEGKKQGATKKSQNTPAGRLLITKVELQRQFQSVSEPKSSRVNDTSSKQVKMSVEENSRMLSNTDISNSENNVFHKSSNKTTVNFGKADDIHCGAKYSDLKANASEYIATWKVIRSATQLSWTEKSPALLDFFVDNSTKQTQSST